MNVALPPFVQDPESVMVPDVAVKVPAESCTLPSTSMVPAAAYVAPVPLIIRWWNAPEAVMLWLPEVPSKRTVLVPAMKSPVPVASQEPETVMVELLEL